MSQPEAPISNQELQLEPLSAFSPKEPEFSHPPLLAQDASAMPRIAPLSTSPQHPTHYEPSDSVPGRLPVRRASSGRFWHGFAVRLAACMDAGRRCNSRLFWTTDAEEMHDSDSNNDFERLLSPEEVARACGLSRRAVYRAIARGELRAARLCHRLRVQPAELERWVGEQTLTPAPPTSGRVTRSMRSVRRGSLRAMLDGVEEREAHGER